MHIFDLKLIFVPSGKQPYLVYAKQEDEEEYCSNPTTMMATTAVVPDATAASPALKFSQHQRPVTAAAATEPRRLLEEVWNEGQGWFGPKPLFMAGLYSVWYSDNDRISRKKPLFSYTVITR